MIEHPTTTNINENMIVRLPTKSVILDIPSVKQWCEESCAAACIASIMRFLEPANERFHDGATIWQQLQAHNSQLQCGKPGTNPQSIVQWAKHEGYSTQLKEERFNDGRGLHWIYDLLASGVPPMVCWADWGGHWCVVTGYISGGTGLPEDDVIVIMDPAEEHVQRSCVNAGRFYLMWYDGQHFERTYYRPLISFFK